MKLFRYSNYFLKLSKHINLSFFRYHLKDVIVGKIYFLLVRIKIKHMEIAIIKRETTGSGMLYITNALMYKITIILTIIFMVSDACKIGI